MYVSNMIGNTGNPIVNQFVVTDEASQTSYFQSYDTIVAKMSRKGNYMETIIDTSWDNPRLGGSKTTSKYLARFLGVPNKEIKQKVKSGEYALVDLNSTPLKDN